MAIKHGAVTMTTNVMAIMALCIVVLPLVSVGQQLQPAATQSVSAESMGEPIPLSGKRSRTKDAEPPPTLVGGASEFAQNPGPKSLVFLTLPSTRQSASLLSRETKPSKQMFQQPKGYAFSFSWGLLSQLP